LYKVGIVGWSVFDEGVGGKGSLMTDWGEWESKVRAGVRVGEKGQNKFLGRGVMDFSTGEGGRVKG
jgi:hypothetical protein